jgi:hypothetical protein
MLVAAILFIGYSGFFIADYSGLIEENTRKDTTKKTGIIYKLYVI